MPGNERIVISASRRTDIPAFYMDWFMDGIGRGCFEVVNPYNQRLSQVPADPERVHTIVFWSKNYGPFLAGRYGERLAAKGYRLYFQFTLNAASKFLEPNLPPLARRLDQMAALCARFGARCVNWRFDPICFFKTPAGGVENNLADFSAIARIAARCGVSRCTTSFMDHYAKIFRRPVPAAGFCFLDPAIPEKVRLLVEMEETLGRLGIGLWTCCEKGRPGGPAGPQPHPRRRLHRQRPAHGDLRRKPEPAARQRPATGPGVRMPGLPGHRLLRPAPVLSQLPVLLCQSCSAAGMRTTDYTDYADFFDGYRAAIGATSSASPEDNGGYAVINTRENP